MISKVDPRFSVLVDLVLQCLDFVLTELFPENSEKSERHAQDVGCMRALVGAKNDLYNHSLIHMGGGHVLPSTS